MTDARHRRDDRLEARDHHLALARRHPPEADPEQGQREQRPLVAERPEAQDPPRPARRLDEAPGGLPIPARLPLVVAGVADPDGRPADEPAHLADPPGLVRCLMHEAVGVEVVAEQLVPGV